MEIENNRLIKRSDIKWHGFGRMHGYLELKTKMELLVWLERKNGAHIETNFTGKNDFGSGDDNFGYDSGLILKCIYIRDGSNINIYIIVIRGKKKHIVAINDTIENICRIDKNKEIQEYITIDVIDNFFKNLTTERLAYIINERYLECDIRGNTDYIYLDLSETNIIGDIRFDKISPGLSSECNSLIELMERKIWSNVCVII